MRKEKDAPYNESMTKPFGRPSTYTAELAAKICELLSTGKSLRKICVAEDMPNRDTVYAWLAKHDDFSDQYARARESWAEAQFEKIIEISDDGSQDTYTDANGVERTNHEAIARSRLRVDTLKWALSKMLPKKYGDRLTQNVDIQERKYDALTDEERARRITAIFERAARRKVLEGAANAENNDGDSYSLV